MLKQGFRYEIFHAKITDRVLSGGINRYTWEEVIWNNVDEVFEVPEQPRSGEENAYELSNLVVSDDTYVQMWLGGYGASGELQYLFQAPGGSTGSLTIKEADGSPSYSGVLTLTVDQADGLTLSQPDGAGTARLDIAAATATQAGIVSTTSQIFAGFKTFNSGVALEEDSTVRGEFRFLTDGDGQLSPVRLVFNTSQGASEPTHEASGLVTASNEFLDSSATGNRLRPGLPVYAHSSKGDASVWRHSFGWGNTDGDFPASGDLGHGFVVECRFLTNTYSGDRAIIAGTSPRFSVYDSATTTLYDGGTATTGGLTFRGGLYISGTSTGLSDGDYGDFTLSGGGTVATIDNDVVTFAKMQNIATDRILGRDTAGSGDVEELTVSGGIEFTGSGGLQTSAFTGDVTKTAGGTALTIPNDTVTFAKMQNIATDRLLGRDTAGSGDVEEITVGGGLEFTTTGGIQVANNGITYARMQDVSATSRILGRKTAGSGDPEECTLSEVLDFVGSAAQGDILYRNATSWVRLGAGTSGHFLKTQGAGANPIWDAASATLDITGLTAASPATDDESPFYDVGGAANKKATLDKILGLSRYAPGGRLTLTSGEPVDTDNAAAGALYYTPYLHDMITLWDGTQWVIVRFSEVSITLSGMTAGLTYDVFAYVSSGALATEILAWTNTNTRATNLSYQDGRLCKSGDKTRLYLGTFLAASTTTCDEDSVGNRHLWNMYNRVPYCDFSNDTTDSWTNNGNGTWSAMNSGNPAWIHTHTIGWKEDVISAELTMSGQGTGFFIVTYDGSTTHDSSHSSIGFFNTSAGVFGPSSPAIYSNAPAVGSRKVTGMQTSFNTSNATFYGDNGTTPGGGNVGFANGLRVRGMR